jgi:hypothetical protein
MKILMLVFFGIMFLFCTPKNHEVKLVSSVLNRANTSVFDFDYYSNLSFGSDSFFIDTVLDRMLITSGKANYFVTWNGVKKDFEFLKIKDSVVYCWKWDSLGIRSRSDYFDRKVDSV